MKTDRYQSYSRKQSGLTTREHDILTLLAQNFSDREVAERLFLAYTTVKWYNRQIFNKLGVDNRKQAVERALELKLIEQLTPVSITRETVPTPLTPFVGRVAELEDLKRFLEHLDTRLITILAPGGMGKTRLALATSESVMTKFPDGVFFLSFAPPTSSTHFLTTLAENIGLEFTENSGTQSQQLGDFLRHKQSLFILDSFEHMLDAAPLIAELLQSSNKLKVLATSRERLNLHGETVFTLGSMSYPASTAGYDARDYEAIQLFTECARRGAPQTTFQDEQSIIRICQLVEGMPLAIELAAAWVGSLSIAQIADEINKSADFLRTSMRNIPEQLRSIRAVFEATWQRLTDNERIAFRNLAVFHNGCTHEAAWAIADADTTVLSALVNKALLKYAPQRDRFEIHELLRQYAEEVLEATGEATIIRSRHRNYFGQYAHHWGKALKTPEHITAVKMLDADNENTRAAFQCAIETGVAANIEPFFDLWYYYELRSRWIEAEHFFSAAIASLEAENTVALGKMLAAHAHTFERYYSPERAYTYAQKSIDTFHACNAPYEVPFPLITLAGAVAELESWDKALPLLHQGLALARQYNDQWMVMCYLYLLSLHAYMCQQTQEAVKILNEVYSLALSIGNLWGLIFALKQLAHLAYEAQDYDLAIKRYRECVEIARKVNYPTGIAFALDGLRAAFLRKHEFELAMEYARQVLQIERETGREKSALHATIALAEVEVRTGNLGEARNRLKQMLYSPELEPAMLAFLTWVTAQYLARTNSQEEAAVLTNFLQKQLIWQKFKENDKQDLQALLSHLETQLPQDRYMEACERANLYTLENIVSTLSILI